MTTFSERLENLIKLHYSNINRELAESIGVNESTISRWLKNPNPPNIRNEVREKIKNAGINVEWLFEGTGEMLSRSNVSLVENAFETKLIDLNSLSKAQLQKLLEAKSIYDKQVSEILQEQ